ncbi:MAG: AAA family ATPase [Sulfolobales archaeon]
MKTCNKESLVIAVSGRPGSGKTTLAKSLAEALGLRYVSSGGIFRKMAEKLGVSLVDMSRIAENDFSIDKAIDEEARNEALKGGVVVDGHIAAWILKDLAHIKISVIAPLEVRVSRIAKRDSLSFEEALRIIKKVEDSENRRFKALYGLDLSDNTVFDLIINTSTFTPGECLNIALEAINEVLNRCASENL